MIHGPLNNLTLKKRVSKIDIFASRQIIAAHLISFSLFFDEFDETNMKTLITNMSNQKFRFQPIKLPISEL